MKDDNKPIKKRYRKDILITCDYCGNIFLTAEPFCPICGKTPEEIIRDTERKKTATTLRR